MKIGLDLLFKISTGGGYHMARKHARGGGYGRTLYKSTKNIFYFAGVVHQLLRLVMKGGGIQRHQPGCCGGGRGRWALRVVHRRGMRSRRCGTWFRRRLGCSALFFFIRVLGLGGGERGGSIFFCQFHRAQRRGDSGSGGSRRIGRSCCCFCFLDNQHLRGMEGDVRVL